MPRSALVLALAFTAALFGCDASGPGNGASVRILLTDAPGDFTAAVVTIDAISLRGESASDEDASGQVVLLDDPVTVDLLTLQNEVLDLVGDAPIPAGAYEELRLVISGGYLAVEQEDGSERIYASSDAYAAEHDVVADGELQMPSFGTSGLKVKLPGDAEDDPVVIEDEQYAVLLDFDVSESFGRQAGNSGRWVMHPVIHATELALTGTAEVTLALADDVALPGEASLADFAIQIDKGGDLLEIPFVPEGEAAAARVLYLAPGAYDVDLVVPEGLAVETDAGLPLLLTIESGQTTEAVLTLTSVAGE
ncbi:MAG: DUF4382 domain-containing protein [Rubricoccaceae bacterium]|nr:DUF4382 domain-containing protein [Rubricoccaceae bacterium]